jgi:hypothetical protein
LNKVSTFVAIIRTRLANSFVVEESQWTVIQAYRGVYRECAVVYSNCVVHNNFCGNVSNQADCAVGNSEKDVSFRAFLASFDIIIADFAIVRLALLANIVHIDPSWFAGVHAKIVL